MRIIIENPFILDSVYEDDIKFIKKCSVVFNVIDEHKIFIYDQKIDLIEDDMATLLCIFDDYQDNIINLEMYDWNRFSLKFKK